MIPEDPDYEQAKDALHNACVPKADELWFSIDRVCVVYVRSITATAPRPSKVATEEDVQINVYEQIGKPNSGGGYAFMSRHYPLSVWRFLWVCGTLQRTTEKQALHFIGVDSLAEMRNRTERQRLKRQPEA